MLEIATRVSRTFSLAQILAIGAVSLIFLVLSYVPLVSVSVSVNGLGDVSRTVGAIWRLTTGVATFVSLLLTYHSFHNEGRDVEAEFSETPGPDTVINVDGGDGNVTLNFAHGEGDVDSVQTEINESADRKHVSDES